LSVQHLNCGSVARVARRVTVRRPVGAVWLVPGVSRPDAGEGEGDDDSGGDEIASGHGGPPFLSLNSIATTRRS